MSTDARTNETDNVSESRSTSFVTQVDASVPDELKRLDRWGIVVVEVDNETGYWEFALDLDSEGYSYAAAIEGIREGRGIALGINLGVVDERRMLVSVEFENCRDPQTGLIRREVLRWLQGISSYTQVTGDGTGIECLMYRSLIREAMVWMQDLGDDLTMSLRDDDSFFLFNRNLLCTSPPQIADCTEVLRRLEVIRCHEFLANSLEANQDIDSEDQHITDLIAMTRMLLIREGRRFARLGWTEDTLGGAIKNINGRLYPAWTGWCGRRRAYYSDECWAKWASFPATGSDPRAITDWALSPPVRPETVTTF